MMPAYRSEILSQRLVEAFNAFAPNPAILTVDGMLSYAELKTASVRMARTILSCDTGNGPVAILGAKGSHTYAGICGSLLASRAYMPLNLRYPAARNIKMTELSGAGTIVADSTSANMLEEMLDRGLRPEAVVVEDRFKELENKYPGVNWICIVDQQDGEFPDITADPSDTAYLLFTSGTTGVPKGVPVSNRNVTAYLDHILDSYEFTEEDRFSHTFDLTFDLSVHDMMVCWLSGACLCIPGEDTTFKMASYIREMEISVWFSVPSAAIMMDRMRLLRPSAFPLIRQSFFCGEPLPAGIATKWKAATGHPLVNLYGPSEATIAISEYDLDRGVKERNGILSIGRLFRGQEYCLLDPGSGEVSHTRGELCLAGSQVIDGYLDDPEMSTKHFVDIGPLPGGKWYRTGDLAEKDEDGDLFFLGRLDTEVKISGYRVNLMEIEGLLRKHSGDRQVAAILDDRGGGRLIAFVEKGGAAGEAELTGRCREELPWYMIPEVIIFVDEMPLNPNGKIDRNRLKQNI